MLNKESVIKLEIPPAMKDRYVIRCLDAKFALSSKDNPMVITEWEVVGIPTATGSLETSVKRGSVEYQIAGLKTPRQYWTLTVKAIGRYIAAWEAAHPGEDFPGVDENNPDLAWLEGLVLNAILTGQEEVMRKILTPEEKAEGKLEADPVLDEDGKPIKTSAIRILEFRSPYTGDLGGNAF